MAFTDHCSIFASVDEDAINRIITHVMRQRPSLFNYGTAYIAQNIDLLCSRIDVAPAVLQRRNPLITIEDPIPIVGTDGAFGLNFCAQLTRVNIDFHPGNVIVLPPELRPPLPEQHFALRAQMCGGLGCPPRDSLKNLTMYQDSGESKGDNGQRLGRMVVLPSERLDCFCLDFFAVGHFEISGRRPNQRLVGKLDGLEIVDIQPRGMENSFECYLRLLAELVILPRTSIALQSLVFEISNLAAITLSATPISAQVPYNPSISDNMIKVFINAEVS